MGAPISKHLPKDCPRASRSVQGGHTSVMKHVRSHVMKVSYLFMPSRKTDPVSTRLGIQRCHQASLLHPRHLPRARRPTRQALPFATQVDCVPVLRSPQLARRAPTRGSLPYGADRNCGPVSPPTSDSASFEGCALKKITPAVGFTW